MQKIDKKASILLWTIFLSIIITMAFLSISTKINKSIKESGDFVEDSNTQTQIKNYIKSGSLSQQYVNTKIGKIELIFESNRHFSGSLKNNEVTEFRFSGTSDFSISLQTLNEGTFLYKFLSFPNAVPASGNVTGSGIINGQKSFNATLSPLHNTGILYIKNLGPTSKYTLRASQDILPPIQKYNTSRKIGNREVIQTSGEIENFKIGDFPSLDYNSYGLDL